MVVQLIIGIVTVYMTPFLDKEPYYITSILSGHAWTQELVNGHPDRIKNKLGMRMYLLYKNFRPVDYMIQNIEHSMNSSPYFPSL
ncbi:hypothetical protein BDR04DRAFT_1105791 [Suillus decipiens]|nr:hypothetical protein BDR04DRAFT_1105791 [Suillus decipiens]